MLVSEASEPGSDLAEEGLSIPWNPLIQVATDRQILLAVVETHDRFPIRENNHLADWRLLLLLRKGMQGAYKKLRNGGLLEERAR